MAPPTRPENDVQMDDVTAEEDRASLVAEGERSAPMVAVDPVVGEDVGKYQLLSLLGQGGAASVFQAKRRPDGAIVALKVLSAEKLSRPRIVQRFYDEAKTASTVQHATLVEFVELLEEEKPRRLAYAMEYVAGQPLRARLLSGQPIPLVECIHIAKQICAGVNALHQAGIVHRDLKPENIMLIPEPGKPPRVKILDFGVAKFLSQPADQLPLAKPEAPGTFVGTPRYMAPEQAAGGAIDGRSDLFAIGVMLFEMITGQRPHEGDSLKAVVMAKLKGAPRLTMNPDREILPQELADVVDACLKLQPDLRPSDARKVSRILDEAQAVLAAVGPIRLDPAAGVVRTTPQTPADLPASPAPPLARDDRNNREVVTLPGREGPSAASTPTLSAPPDPPALPTVSAPPMERAPVASPPRGRLWLLVPAVTIALALALTAVWLFTMRTPEVYVLPVPEVSKTALPTPEVRASTVAATSTHGVTP